MMRMCIWLRACVCVSTHQHHRRRRPRRVLRCVSVFIRKHCACARAHEIRAPYVTSSSCKYACSCAMPPHAIASCRWTGSRCGSFDWIESVAVAVALSSLRIDFWVWCCVFASWVQLRPGLSRARAALSHCALLTQPQLHAPHNVIHVWRHHRVWVFLVFAFALSATLSLSRCCSVIVLLWLCEIREKNRNTTA